MQTIGVIPARLQSTRLPRKLLLAETGKPLIQHVWEAASRCDHLDAVMIATDSPEIAAVVRSFGARCELTGEHPSGTDRIAEVVRRCCPKADIIVNIQGDEPEIEPAQIDHLIASLKEHPEVEMSTLATPITSLAELRDPSCTKVVRNLQGQAMYFSRHPIPFLREGNPEDLLKTETPWLLHLGLYAYRRKFLLKMTNWAPSRLETLEKLEQLRALENGAQIQVALTTHRAAGIDTPEDYTAFVSRQTKSRAA